MTVLQKRLAGIRRLMRATVLYRGLTALLVVVLACLIGAGLLDWTLRLPSLVRALLLVGTVSGAGYLAWRSFVQPLWGKTDDLTLALRVEERYPVLNDALASTVQFLQQGHDPKRGDSSSLRRETMERAMRLAEGCNFNDVVDTRGVFVSSVGAFVAAGLTAFLLWTAPGLAHTAVLRFLDPFGNHSWTRLTIERCPERVALGSPYVIRGQVAGIVPEQASVEVQSLDDQERDGPGEPDKRWVSIKHKHPKDAVGELETALDMTQQRGKFRFRIRANDAVYPARGRWHDVNVVPPPKLAMLNGLPSPQCELRYPAYTELPSPEKLSPGSQNIDAVAGTEVTLRAATDRPIHQAWIEYRGTTRDAEQTQLASALMHLGALGASHPFEHFASAVGTHAAWGRAPASLAKNGTQFTVKFMPWLTGFYALHLEDDEGLPGEYMLTIRVQADPAPVVTLDRPGSNQDVLADAEIGLKVLAVDTIFAVRSVYLEYRRQDAEGKWLDDEPKRLILHQPAAGHVTNGPPAGERPKRVDVARTWPIKGLAQVGEGIVLQACADDFNNVVAFNQPGRSAEVVLRIVSPRQLAKRIDEDLGQIQQELVRIQQMQQEALGQVEKVKDNIEKPGFRPHEALAEAEEKQKQIQARIGPNPEEGLRADIDKLKQLIKDNKLPPSEVQDRLRTLNSELERINREDLEQIEANLAEARKQLREGKPTPPSKEESLKGKSPKETSAKDKSPKEKPALDKAQEHQKNAQKGLDDLVKFMDPWAGMHQVKGTARQILEQQRDLNRNTAKLDKQIQAAQELAKKIAELDKQLQQKKGDPAKLQALQEELKNQAKENDADLKKTANAQNDLAEKMEDLIKLMEKAQKKRAADGDHQTAKVLKDAHDQADKGLIPEKMRQAKRSLERKDFDQQPNPDIPEALRNQEKSIDELEKVLAALDERRDDHAEKLLQKQRQAEEVLDKLKKKQDVLAKKTKEQKQEIDKLAKKQRDIKDKLDKKQGDPDKLKAEQQAVEKQLDEHKRELARLAEEQRKLKEEAQEKARELARLQADQASKALSKAGQEMERAAKMLDDGQDPGEAQAEAMERIEDAQAKLQQAEDELAREQLAKIADKLKGLKERQDRFTAESARLHKESIEKSKHWTGPLLQSLKGLARVQKSLGQETDSLKDKLKQAKVFAHILSRSVEAMDKAADGLEQRFDKGSLRQDPLEIEELADEVKAQDETQRLQKEAGRRLQRLLDALKDQKPQARRPRPKDGEKKGGPKEKEEEKGGLRGPGDGIPPMAQLKALRDEQQEVNDRTKDFAKRFPNWPKLNDEQRAQQKEVQTEYSDIQVEQNNIQRLFDEITAQTRRKGENPPN